MGRFLRFHNRKMGLRYKNKYFREVLQKDLQSRDLGVNIHCRQDGIHITVPPYPVTEDSFTNSYADQLLREDYDTERIVKAVKIVAKEYSVNIDLEKAVYGDNVRIKLKVDER